MNESPPHALNALTLEKEIVWFSRKLEARMQSFFGNDIAIAFDSIAPPALEDDTSPYASTIRECKLGSDERVLLILLLLPVVRPWALDVLFIKNPQYDRRFTEFGGVVPPDSGFIPTCETALFILAGSDLQKRFEITRLLGNGSVLVRRGIIEFAPVETVTNPLRTRLSISPKYLGYFTVSEISQLSDAAKL
jgi:hypothetical protein